MFAGDVHLHSRRSKTFRLRIIRRRLQIDRTLETLVLRAEGESDLFVNLSGKRTKTFSLYGNIYVFSNRLSPIGGFLNL